MLSSVCNAWCNVDALPLRSAVSATFKLVGLRSSMAARVFCAQARISAFSWVSITVFKSVNISSTVLCRNTESRTCRLTPVKVDNGSSGSRSCECSSRRLSMTGGVTMSNDASFSRMVGILRDGIKCVAKPKLLDNERVGKRNKVSVGDKRLQLTRHLCRRLIHPSSLGRYQSLHPALIKRRSRRHLGNILSLFRAWQKAYFR